MVRSKAVLYPFGDRSICILRAELRSIEIIPSTQGMMPFVTGSLKSFFNLSLKRKKKIVQTQTLFFFKFRVRFKSLPDHKMGGRRKNYFFFLITLVSL